MLEFVLAILICISLLIVCFILFKAVRKESVKKPCFCLALCIVLSTVDILLLGDLNNVETKREELYTTARIVALQDKNTMEGNVSGNLFYIKGSIETTHVYTYYKELDDGGLKLESVPAKMSVIYEEAAEDCNPRLEEYSIYDVPKNEFWRKHPKLYSFLGGNTLRSGIVYKFYVPQGSVLNEIQLDAQ